MEVGTLSELNVQPGEFVEFVTAADYSEWHNSRLKGKVARMHPDGVIFPMGFYNKTCRHKFRRLKPLGELRDRRLIRAIVDSYNKNPAIVQELSCNDWRGYLWLDAPKELNLAGIYRVKP